MRHIIEVLHPDNIPLCFSDKPRPFEYYQFAFRNGHELIYNEDGYCQECVQIHNANRVIIILEDELNGMDNNHLV